MRTTPADFHVSGTVKNDVSELIEAAQRGDELAWRELCAHYLPKLERFAATQGADDPAGLASTALLEFYRSARRFRGRDRRALDAYIYRTARNRIIDEHRKNPNQTVPLVTADVDLDRAPKGEIDELVAGDFYVNELLSNLSEDQRKVLELRVIEDRSARETAAILDKPLSTVNVLQHRALKALRVVVAAALVAAVWFGIRQLTDDNRSISVEPADVSVPNTTDSPDGSSLDSPNDRSEESTNESSNDDGATSLFVPRGAETEPVSGAEPQTAPDQLGADSTDATTTTVTSTVAQSDPSTTTTSPPTTGPPETNPPTTSPPYTNPPSTGPPTTFERPVTTARNVTTSTTRVVPPVVDAPEYCEVQMASSGVGTTGVEIHDAEQRFAERYVLYDRNLEVVWSGSDPQQVQGVEIEFESIPSGFNVDLVHYAAAQNGDDISAPTLCLRRS